MVWRKPPFTDNEQRNWDLLGDAAEGGGSGGGNNVMYVMGEYDNNVLLLPSSFNPFNNPAIIVEPDDNLCYYPLRKDDVGYLYYTCVGTSIALEVTPVLVINHPEYGWCIMFE